MQISKLSEGQLTTAKRGKDFEKDLVLIAREGLKDNIEYESRIKNNLFLTIFQSMGYGEEEIRKGIDPSKKKDDGSITPGALLITKRASKADVIIGNRKISVKLIPAQLTSLEPHTSADIIEKIIAKEPSKYEDQKEHLQNLINELRNYNKRYVQNGQDLKDSIENKYKSRFKNFKDGKYDLRNEIKDFSLSEEDLSDESAFLQAVETALLNKLYEIQQKISAAIEERDKQLKKTKQEIGQLPVDSEIKVKSIKTLESASQFNIDKQVIIKNFEQLIEILNDDLNYESATGYYSLEEPLRADYILCVSESPEKVIFSYIKERENLKNVLSQLNIKTDVRGKSRKYMTKALNFRYDISLKPLLQITDKKTGEAEEKKVTDIKEYLLETINSTLEEELELQEQLISHVKDKLDSLNKKELKIVSITPSNKSDMAIVLRFEDKENIESARSKVKNILESEGITIKDRLIPKYDSSIECTQISYSDGSGRVYVVYKYDIGSREGLALEHVVAMVLTGKITEELKNRLDLPPDATKEEILEKLKGDYADVLDVALKGKKLIEEKIGKVLNAKSLGSKNAKADLVLDTESGRKIGLSIKLVTEEGRELRFTYNKNLGYGDEAEDNLVRNPSGKSWWLVGRQILAKKLGKSYNPKEEDFEPPSWMEKERKDRSEAYKETMEEVYEQLRNVFVDNLRHLKLKELVRMVNKAHLGENEENYEELLVLISDVDGLRLEKQEESRPDIEKIKTSGITKNDIVKQDGARIIIDIPGMEPLTIHGLKFQNNMLSSSKNDLKIKTR